MATVCKPIFKFISQWKDLEKYRDNIVAHGWRNNGHFVNPLTNRYLIPRTWLEVRILKDLMTYVHDIIKKEFEMEMDESLFLADSLTENVNVLFTGKNINSIIKTLVNEVNEIMQGRDYTGTIFIYK